MTTIQLIAAERLRQCLKGFDAAHDDRHVDGEILTAAGWIIYAVEDGTHGPDGDDDPDATWMEKLAAKVETANGGDPIRRLVIAAALVAAEIDRLRRAKGEKIPDADPKALKQAKPVAWALRIAGKIGRNDFYLNKTVAENDARGLGYEVVPLYGFDFPSLASAAIDIEKLRQAHWDATRILARLTDPEYQAVPGDMTAIVIALSAMNSAIPALISAYEERDRLREALQAADACGFTNSSWAHITSPPETAASCGCPKCTKRLVRAVLFPTESEAKP